MLHIRFKYKDKYSNGKWNEMGCYVSSLQECKRIYRLGIDYEYQIVSVKEVKE